MNRKINLFIFEQHDEVSNELLIKLRKESRLNKIYVLTKKGDYSQLKGAEAIFTESFFSSKTFNEIIKESGENHTALLFEHEGFEAGQFCFERISEIIEQTNSGIIYSDYYLKGKDRRQNKPLIDYQIGSVRDEFDFGALVTINRNALKILRINKEPDFRFAGWYDLRLKISENFKLFHVREPLYSLNRIDFRKSGQKQFDYVKADNRTIQKEMETAFTNHLKRIGAFLNHGSIIEYFDDNFPVEASVIIPVKNRVQTIGAAIKSALSQTANFNFNVIVVNNHSTDGTKEVIEGFSAVDKRVIQIVPERKDLGIGGCWNVAINDYRCGKFAVQLDSDDVYKDEQTLQKIVDAFYKEQAAMVIGSYTLTNFNFEKIPPGDILHDEWTQENGHNNALRINGFGAPRAFYTPIIRNVRFPNVSYGEDYAVGLAISRRYKIARIFEPLYYCRRWENNTDNDLPIEKLNEYNLYKDSIRTIEILARKALNEGNE